MRKALFIFCTLGIFSCKKEASEKHEMVLPSIENIKETVLVLPEVKEQKENNSETIKDTSFVNIQVLSSDFVLDLKYATTDNFLHQKVYDCPECFLRISTTKALVKANQELIKKGFRIKLYDCYRPLDVQKKMWKILPGTNYVANPKKGSKHNRGAAVDLTLVDSFGNELDMGTKFDFFGREAHHTYLNLPKEVLQNRKLLKETLAKYDFKSIYNEWWHYEFRPERHSTVSNFKWKCN
ncbi:M15 family metallopeptidase [uncultured Flavobacterium sp.]|mgnify:CR=1 FL=1|uniref:M15 family metallopeptidase n=1 Tax=uncultured Flavobacterium sp. TaxID=165435 RepID=UPI0030EDD011